MAGPRRGSERPDSSKVPDITPWFWAVKLLTTCMGEAVSDYLAGAINPYLAVCTGFVVWVIAMTWVFRAPRYRIGAYWFAVSSVAVFGTMPPDALHIQFGIPYQVTSAGFAICLAIVLSAWYRSEGTLDIHSITTTRREVFYWLTVLSTFALGTALGDLIATPFHLGFLTAGILFSALILIPLAAWRLGANPVLTFWAAYILTRPIGASFADLFGQPKAISGLGYGHPVVFAVSGVLVTALVSYLKVTGKDLLPRRGAGYSPRHGPRYEARPAAYAEPGYAAQHGYAAPRPTFTPRADLEQRGGLRREPPPARREPPPPGDRW